MDLNKFIKWAESKYGHKTNVGKQLGHTKAGQGGLYYGRGYVQLTGFRNYDLFSKRLNIDLVNNPDLALDCTTASYILFEGMIEGLYTGKALNDYINDKQVDYINARRIVNGIDKAKLIAGYAEKFERGIK